MDKKMESDLINIITKYISGEISDDRFLSEFFRGKDPSSKETLERLSNGIIDKDASVIELVIILLYTGKFSISVFSEELSALLLMPWHYKHEDIASLLKEVKDPLTVVALYEASTVSFEYLDYDETYQLARKCIKALAAIGNEEAIDYLMKLSRNSIEEVASYAKKELHKKELL